MSRREICVICGNPINNLKNEIQGVLFHEHILNDGTVKQSYVHKACYKIWNRVQDASFHENSEVF
jgi:hypothetical protein